MKRNAVVLFLIVILAGLAVYQKIDAREKAVVLPTEVAPRPQYLAPDFALKALDGNTYQVGGKRDKPLFLNFWASWCGPCEEEAPELSRLFEKYQDRLDLYAVNVTKNDTLSEVKKFVSLYRFTFPVLLDEELTASEKYRFQVIPTSFLIDTNGVIVDAFNLLEPKDLEKRIKKLIDNS